MQTLDAPPTAWKEASQWAGLLPDGAVSFTQTGTGWTLRASQNLQARFEELLEHRKRGALSEPDEREYEAICHLDESLSWLNRLIRTM
ncbi:MAG: hypothetical protein HZA46_24875 [Planctomycetales bacterium]|nr:hypothetical protein [Planctomycetales bacterium]